MMGKGTVTITDTLMDAVNIRKFSVTLEPSFCVEALQCA